MSKEGENRGNTVRLRFRELPNRRRPRGFSGVENELGDGNISNKNACDSSGACEEKCGMSSIGSPGCSHRRISITASSNANTDHCRANIGRRKAVAKRNPCSPPTRKVSFKSESIDKYATCSSRKKLRTQTLKVKRRSVATPVSSVIPSKDHTGQPPLVSDFIKFLCNYDSKDTCIPNKEWFGIPHVLHGKSLPRSSQSSQPSSKSSKREQLNSNTMNSTANITVECSEQIKPKEHSWLRGVTIPRKFPHIEQPRFTCSAHDFLLENGFR
nr:unnamed protein product [Trichobilharzia regenti]